MSLMLTGFVEVLTVFGAIKCDAHPNPKARFGFVGLMHKAD
jgi:hypothetical protein